MPTFLSVATNTFLRERIASKGKNATQYGTFIEIVQLTDLPVKNMFRVVSHGMRLNMIRLN
jgi:hypothetical protein